MGLYSKHIFPFFLDKEMSHHRVGECRKRLLPDASGNVLEVGFATGLNMPFYPDTVEKPTVVDANPGMSRPGAEARRGLQNRSRASRVGREVAAVRCRQLRHRS